MRCIALEQLQFLRPVRHLLAYMIFYRPQDGHLHIVLQNSTISPQLQPLHMQIGVPQGSILGPLFFILYVNDLNNASLLDAILFADDTNLFISHNDPVYLINTLNRELNKLSTWFAANRLSLN